MVEGRVDHAIRSGRSASEALQTLRDGPRRLYGDGRRPRIGTGESEHLMARVN